MRTVRNILLILAVGFVILMIIPLDEEEQGADTGLRHLLNLKLPTSRRNAVFFCQIFLNYMLCAVVFCVIIKYEDLV